MKGLYGGHGGMESAHKLLHSQEVLFVFEPDPPGDLFLIVKTELIISPSGQIMQVISDKPYQFQVAPEFLLFAAGKFSQILQIPGHGQAEKGPGQPKHMVVIP